ncbi:hypothetical protein EV121DRAFT_290585 [Schizophyllum commune]
MALDHGAAILQRVRDAVKEADPLTQAELLEPLSQPNTWLRAFPFLTASGPPQVPSRPGTAVNPRIRGVISEMRVLSRILMPYPKKVNSPVVLRTLLVGFPSLWTAAWTWIDFINPLFGKVHSEGHDRLSLSVAIPAMLAMALKLALKDTDPQSQATDTMSGAPLTMLIALWYHDHVLDDSDSTLMQLESDSDESLFLRTRHSQGTIGEFLAKTDSPYYDRVVEVLAKISGGHPGRLRRRMLANLERGLHLRHHISHLTWEDVYINPIVYLARIPSYTFPPSSSRTIRRQTSHLLELSRAPDTAVRAASMGLVLYALHSTELDGRVIYLALSCGLLTGLRNTLAQLALLPAGDVLGFRAGPEVMITTVCMTTHLRHVAKRFISSGDVLVLSGELPSHLGMLPMRWEQLVEEKRLLSLAWQACRQRLKSVRHCSNPTCTSNTDHLKSCACREVYYCSEACQRIHWRVQHRVDCEGAVEAGSLKLGLEDRMFLEETTRCRVNVSHSLLCKEIALPAIQADLKDGCHIELHVIFDAETPNFDFRVDTVDRWTAEGAQRTPAMMYIVADFEYFHVKETLRLDPLPLQEFLNIVVHQPSYPWRYE